MLHAYGAELVFTDPMEGSDGAIREARRIYAARPGPLLLSRSVQQRRQLARALRHDRRARSSSRPAAALTHFVAGLGTSGTFVGTGRRLRAVDRSIRAHLGAAGLAAARLEGLKHMASAIVPAIYDPVARRRHARRSRPKTRTSSRAGWRAKTGLFVGPSSGAALAACLDVARTDSTRGVIVTVFPDGGDRYLSESLLGRTPTARRCATPRVDVARARSARTANAAYPDECCGALLGRAGRQSSRRCRSRQHHRPASAAADSSSGPTTIARAEAHADDAGRELARLLSLASGSPGGAVGVRSRARVAEPELRDRLGRAAAAAGVAAVVAASRRPVAASTKNRIDRKETRHASPILIPTPLRPFTGQQAVVQVDGATSAKCCAQLTATARRSPRSTCSTTDGKLRSFVNVYVNDEDIRHLKRRGRRRSAPADTVSIVPSVAGGSVAEAVDASCRR